MPTYDPQRTRGRPSASPERPAPVDALLDHQAPPAEDPVEDPARNLARNPDDASADTPAESPVDTPAESPADTPAESPADTRVRTRAGTMAETVAESSGGGPAEAGASRRWLFAAVGAIGAAVIVVLWRRRRHD